MDKQVEVLLPNGGPSLSITGSADDFGVIGAIERAGGHYEPQVMQVLSRLVRSGDVCIDIGANIGVLTLLLAHLAPAGRVFAFEPGDASFGYLARNVTGAGATNVEVAQLGVYDVTGRLTLQVAASHPGGAYISQTEAHEATSESIPVTRLDDWVTDHDVQHVDVVKLDIEGAELRVIDGASETLRRFRPVLVVECNPVALERFQKAGPGDLVRVLRAIYGKVFFIDGTAIREIASDEQLARELGRHGIVDLVCGPRAEAIAVQSAPTSPRTVVAQARRVAGAARRRIRSLGAARGPAAVNFVHSPSYDARFDVNRLVETRGTTIDLAVVVQNTGPDWFSSTFANHPVCASYRWTTPAGAIVEADGIRTFFREPLGPGEETELTLRVAVPEEPGEYVLEFALVQEAFAWFDDLRPALARRLPVIVR